ncbi:hypothetical protein AAG570_000755 [Ranatra chinensis]|uniref:Ataxin-2 C-terminal domain-containing protein n=1 Tax=Ranatra chinensis TaxID=642074 RepID=A0ABD0ZAN6_9HEMI
MKPSHFRGARLVSDGQLKAVTSPPPLITAMAETGSDLRIAAGDGRFADDVVEGEAESGDDSEEEWNYIRGEEKEADQKQEEDQDDMESRLNPNAAEFVPGLQLDPVLASSPVNGKEKSLDDVTVPPIKEFYSEICHRPSEIEPACEKSDLLYAETSLNGDETEGLSTKAEFGDESTYSISVSMNTSIALLPDEENRLNETNPFCKSENKLDDVENEFIKDNFSLPNMEFKQVDEPLQESVDEDSFTMSPDLERPNSMNQVTSPHPQGFDSPYDFTSNTDAFSPVDLPERLTANQEPTSSSGFDSESNEEIDSNIQEKTIDGISFGDGVDVDEILKSKQDVDTPAKETDSLMTESLADALPQVSGDSEDNLKSDFILDEDVERPVSPNKVVSPVPISSVEVNSVDSQPLEHLDLKELPKKDEDDEDSTVPLESPVNEGPGSELDEMAPHEGDIEGVVSFVLDEETTVPKVVHEESVVPEVVNEETIVPKVVHEETIVPKVVHEETIVPEVVNEETTVPKVVHEETNPTVDFIQELQFNESSVEKEESLPHSNDNTMESEIEAGFEIISHETAKEFDIEIKSESAKELSNVDEKLLMDKNEMELLSPQSDEVEDNEISHAKENTEINIISKSDIFQENHADINILEKEEHMEQECLPGKIDVNDVNNIINVAVKEEVFEKEVNDTFVSTFKETKENEEGDAFELKSNQPVIGEQLKNDSIISAVEEAMLEESKEGKADDSSLLVKVDILEDLSKGEISTSIEHIEPIENRAVDEQLNEEIIVTEENDFKRENIFESYSTIKEETVVDLKGETIITEELKETTRLSPTLNDEQKILDKDVSLIHHDHAQDISLKACGSLLVTSEVVDKEDLQGDTSQTEVKTESMDDSKAISQGLFENDKPLIIESTQEIQHDPEVTIKEIKVEALIEEIKTDKCSILENTEKELKQAEEDKIVKESDGLIDVSIPTEVNLVETAKPILDIEVPSLVAIETSKVTEDAAAGTPPSTPAPGPVADDNKEGLIAAAVAAAAAGMYSIFINDGAATVVAASTMASVPEKDVEKHDPIKKPTTAVTSPKKPATTKPTAGSTLTAKSATTKSPAKPAGSTSSPTKKPLAAATPAGTKAPSKPGTPASKPGTPVKPSTPTSKTAATKVSAAKPSMSAAKPTTGTGKTASKPSTPPQAKPKVESSKSAAAAKPSAPMAGKAKASTTATKPTSAEKPAAKKEEVLKKPAVASKAPPAATKAAPAARPTAASKPAVKAATPTEAAAKRPPSQSGLTKPAAAAATKSATAAPTAKPAAKPQSRPPSAKPSAPAPASSKPAAKAVTTTAKTATAKPTPPAAAKTAPAKPTTTSAKPKAPAAAAPANKTKPVPIKKPTPTDKSVKDATNNKLSAKSQVKKTDPKLSDKDNDKKAPLIEDPSLMQEHIVTTTNGHLDILENGIENGQDSPIEKSHPEIIEALN